MKTSRMLSLVVAGVIGAGSSIAWADSLCSDKALQQAADAQVKRAEDLERAGKAREAYHAAAKANGECVTDYKRHSALMVRAALALGVDEEKKRRFKEAFDWYERAQRPADAGRMQRKMVDASPDDINTVSRAIDYFKNHQEAAQEQAMRAHALMRVDHALIEEDRRFNTFTKDSLRELGLARDWSHYAQAGEDRTRARAAKRGDTLLAEDGRKFLSLALSYYEAANQPEKAQKVRDKARALAKQHEGKGEGVIAAEYYVIAGDSGQANAVQAQTEAREQKAEATRKKTFKKEQDDLEKALGF